MESTCLPFAAPLKISNLNLGSSAWVKWGTKSRIRTTHSQAISPSLASGLSQIFNCVKQKALQESLWLWFYHDLLEDPQPSSSLAKVEWGVSARLVLVLGSGLSCGFYTTDEKHYEYILDVESLVVLANFFSFCVFRNKMGFHHLTSICAPGTLSHHAIRQIPCTFMTVCAFMPTLVLPGIGSPISAPGQFLLILAGPPQALPPQRVQSSMDFP